MLALFYMLALFSVKLFVCKCNMLVYSILMKQNSCSSFFFKCEPMNFGRNVGYHSIMVSLINK